VLICHDIPKGVNEDPVCFNDFSKQFAYRFEHWANIDWFIYFGHYRITIPPPSWVNQAHRNGVKMLGTLIFEWEDGARECKEMLDGVLAFRGTVIEDDIGSLFYAEKLVEIAKFFNLDGYLMNFESQIPQEYVDTALQFLEYLKMRLRDEVGAHSELIWYDSVIATTGEVRWQSALREWNKPFFDVWDSFFTDYHWKPEFLDESLMHAGDRSYEIYVGNDIYGRGTFGGGIYNTHLALHEILQRPLSIALFGQAYFYENNGGWRNELSFRTNEEQFWEGKKTIIFRLPNKRKEINLTKNEDGTYTGVNDWKNFQGDFKLEEDKEFDTVAVASHMWCRRVFEIPISSYVKEMGKL
jgi:mannosyl-glycoprotein endo-beta-N-acetylglucosaminidase